MRAAWALLLVSLLMGCHLLWPFEPARVDGGVADARADGAADARADGAADARADGAADARAVEADGDGDATPVRDAPRHGLDRSLPPADGHLRHDAYPLKDLLMWPDLLTWPSDRGPVADTGGTTTGPGCSSLGHEYYDYPGGDMVICMANDTTQYNQCKASLLCGSDSHLCTASEYRLRGGTSTGRSEGAWLSSCIRERDALSSPTDLPCSMCSGGTASSVTVGWYCDPAITATYDFLKTDGGEPIAP